ncbi:hypothetical protein GCM10023191_064810 [Actinoallomurus oryzae]|uniref:Uncharacterized protein n=1 Tax=Actinoallomurus oryzae TaxID=502180 RepID=A0ABP8QNH8_9ACTN
MRRPYHSVGELRQRTLSLARQNDGELLSAVDPAEAAALHRALSRIAAATGLIPK